MPTSKPNHFSLHGDKVTIEYSLSDVSGQPTLNFKVDTHSGTAHKQQIHVTNTDVGQLITFALKSGPDADEGDPKFSFLLPQITLESASENAFETIGFKTITTRKGPAHQRYTYVALKGKSSFVQSLATHAHA
jgi:hypothetical protein